jgi:hypothetical protein
VRPVNRFGADFDELGRRAADGYGSHFVRDAEYFNWRYLDSPRDYRCFGAYRGDDLCGVAVVGHTFKHGVSAGFLADLVAAPAPGSAVRALVARAVAEVKGGADALVLLPPPSGSARRALAASGFALMNGSPPIGKPLRGAPLTDEGAALHRGLRLLRRRVVSDAAGRSRILRSATVPKIAAVAAPWTRSSLADGCAGRAPANTRVRTFRSSRKPAAACAETALAREPTVCGWRLSPTARIYAVLAAKPAFAASRLSCSPIECRRCEPLRASTVTCRRAFRCVEEALRDRPHRPGRVPLRSSS